MTAKIILSGGQKGGTGKTMLATNLAVLYAALGLRVLLLDVDPQGSSWDWAQDRLADGTLPKIESKQLKGNLFYSLLELERHYDVIVIDAAGAKSEEFISACLKAHVVLPTLLPSKCDFRTIGVIDEVVGDARDAGNEHLIARVVLNKGLPQSAGRLKKARANLEKLRHLKCADTALPFRIGHQDAYDENKAIHELGESAAAEDVRVLFAEVQGYAS